MRVTSSITRIIASAAMAASPLVFAMQPSSSAQISPHNGNAAGGQQSKSPSYFGAKPDKKPSRPSEWAQNNKSGKQWNPAGTPKLSGQGMNSPSWNSNRLSANSGQNAPK